MMNRSPSPSRLLPLPVLGLLSLLSGPLMGQVEKPAAPQPPEPPGLQTIQAQDLKSWAGYLASDALNGRLTGSPGQRMAEAYITKHFEKLGLEPLGDAGADGKPTYIQRYPLARTSLNPEATRLTVGEPAAGDGTGPGPDVFDRGFAVIPPAGKKAVTVDATGPFVYAGLIGSRSFKSGVELESWEGKIPVLVVKEPKSRGVLSIERQMGAAMFVIANLKRRAGRFARLGAETVVFCVLDDNSPVSNMLTYISVAPGQDMMQKQGSLGMGQMMAMMAGKVPTVYTSRKVSAAILKAIGLTEEAAAEAQEEEAVAALKSAPGRLQLQIDHDPKAFATNVVAVLRGSDPKLRDEAVVFSAHMDHVGVRMDGDAYNGADDNASGSAGLMGIARAFASLETPPRRSVIFLSVSGEELGLWGSEHYAANPTWDVDKIVANVNTDMIGRNGPESGPQDVTVTPSNRHLKFSTIVQDAAAIGERLGVKFSSGDKYYERSDHYNFAKRGIPVVFFCNGEHEDYHQVTDHAEKLSGPKMELIARLAYWTGYQVAQADERPSTLGRSETWLPEKK